jgi:lipoprotein NlpD
MTTVKKPTETVAKSTPSVGTNVQDTVKNGSLTWSWPMTGSLLKRFSTEGVGSKGIDIAGKRGDIVKAAADGVVVYAGEGLVGYGKLLIVRHNDEYITAYAHNDRLIATEGQKLKLGQTIAEVGSTGTDKDKLHFEIRYKGKPIDPLTILPK